MTDIRYCNVRREDDKVTKWIAENWRAPHRSDPNLTFAMVAARMVNWPSTLEEIGFPKWGTNLIEWSTRAKAIIRRLQDAHIKAWTSAYTISTCGRRMKKEDYVFDHVLDEVAGRPWDSWYAATPTLESAHYRLRLVDGLGNFLAAQVVADLKNTDGHMLSGAEDWWTWSAPGPGSLLGLKYFFDKKITASQYPRFAKEAYVQTKPLVPEYVGRLHMQDFQNCLCEFSKYMKAKEGGHVHNRYTATAG